MNNKEEQIKMTAWNNALNFEIDNPKKFKVCYICYGDYLLEKITKKEVIMNFDYYEDDAELNGWCVDYIDGNRNNKENNNIVAIHYDCHKIKKHQNFIKLYQEYKNKVQK